MLAASWLLVASSQGPHCLNSNAVSRFHSSVCSFLTVRRIWQSASPLDGSGSCRLNLVPGFAVAQNVQFSGGSRKTAKIDNLRVLSKNPKKHEKNAFFGPLKKGAQLCGGSRRIIYCLDTRYGPQTMLGGIPGPPKMGGVGFGDRQNRKRGFRFRKRGFRVSAKCAFCTETEFRFRDPVSKFHIRSSPCDG